MDEVIKLALGNYKNKTPARKKSGSRKKK